VFLVCKGLKLTSFDDNLTFFRWLKLLHKRYRGLVRDGFDHQVCRITDQYSDLLVGVTFFIEEVQKTPGKVEEFTKSGFMFLSDFNGILEELIRFSPTIYKQAIVKGLAFTARGKVFREAMVAPSYEDTSCVPKVVHTYPTNPLNLLENHWWKSDDYSSWCEIKHYDPNEVTATTRTVTEMGQSNYFFRLNLTSDKLLHGLAFANMTLRHTKYDAKKRHFYVSPADNSFNPSRQFVCLNYVCSTKLALSVLNEDNLPIVKQRKFGSARWTVDPKVIRIAPPNSTANRIYFLEMHPERVDYMYQSFEEDLDGSRNWDIL